MHVLEESFFSIKPFAHEQKLVKFLFVPLQKLQFEGVPLHPSHLLSQGEQSILKSDD